MQAKKNKNYSKAASLIEDPKVALYKSKSGETPLIIAIKNDNLDLVINLIKQGADVNNITSSFSSPLLKAKSIKVAKALVENGADYNYNSPNYGTVLHNAVRENYELLDYYLNLGVDVNLKSKASKISLSRRIDDFASEEWSKRKYVNAYQNKVDRNLFLN